MRPSYFFLGAAVLIALLLLILFGTKSLSPINPQSKNANLNAPAGAQRLQTPSVVFGNPVRGATEAKVTIVEFGDYLCAPCASFETAIKRVLADFPTDVRLVWKDFPNTALHKEALRAAVAARCAADQGYFWQYHDILLERQNSIDELAHSTFAKELALNQPAFNDCVAAESTKPIVERDFEEGQRLSIDGTPYLFIKGRRVSGEIGYEELRGFVQTALAEANAEFKK